MDLRPNVLSAGLDVKDQEIHNETGSLQNQGSEGKIMAEKESDGNRMCPVRLLRNGNAFQSVRSSYNPLRTRRKKEETKSTKRGIKRQLLVEMHNYARDPKEEIG